MATEPDIWTIAVNVLTVGAAWIAGEGGRIAVAGGAGGLSRWLSSERRRLLDGLFAVGGGLVSGTYLWPLVLKIIGLPFGGLSEAPNNVAMAAFVAGALGMSFVKIITAMVEAKVAGQVKGKADE